ncbi:PBP1A family penicillin-binding protein [bacterium]|nr:PBP1A family penicillin-binding protein [bacterium]
MHREINRHYRKLGSDKKGFKLPKLLFYLFGGAVLGFLLPALLIFIVYILYQPQLPDPQVLEDYQPAVVTRIYSIDGEVLAEFAGEKRIWVPISEVSENIINAILAAEDKRFYEHWGINASAIFRAIYVDIKQGRRAQGASTITQQLTRELFLSREKLLTRKIREALTALKIERMYSKSEILELFINQQYLGKGCYGVEAASKYYFRKEAKDVDEREAATIAGLLQRPSHYSNNLKLLKSRRNTVLSLMLDNEMFDRTTYDSLSALDIGIEEDQEAISWKAPYFVENIRQYIEREYGESYLYERGITIYSTLDWELQQLADTVFAKKIDALEKWQRKIHHNDDTVYTEMAYDSISGDSIRQWKELQGALLALVPATGEIRAMIGGRDFLESQYNRSIQGGRQAGSAFKPFVYTAAIDNGWTPVDTLLDTPEVYPMGNGELWAPKNYDHEYKGTITLREALRASRNAATVKLCNAVGPKRVVWYAKRMGISTELEPYLSISMGTSDVKLIDLVEAYAVFPNMGVRVKPTSILRIIDRNGKIIENRTPVKEEVLSPATAYVMTSMLQTVVDHGTGYAARLMGFDRPAGGKTGTTDDYSDAWFIGFTPQLCCGVQVGYDDYSTPIGNGMTGSRAALPIWAQFMLYAHVPDRYPLEDFQIPAGKVSFVDVCSESHKLATSQCPKVIHEVFVMGKQPTDYCPPGFHNKDNRPVFDRRQPQNQDQIVPNMQGGKRTSPQKGRF